MTDSKLLRTLLFVPADSEAKMAKARGIPADALVLDWEDSVLPGNKSLARASAASFLRKREELPQAILIRLNQVGTDGFQSDCEALANGLPDGVMLGKCCSAEHVLTVAEFLRHKDPQGKCSIYPLIESAIGVTNALQIAASSDLIAGMAFGAQDFSADVGIHCAEDEIELLFGRCAVVTAARAAKRDVYDSPCLDLTDADRLAASAQRARRLGFTGKMAIHPAQVPVLNEIFSPAATELEHARRIIETFAAAESGVLALDGQMVDEAVVRGARRALNLAAQFRSEETGR